MYTVQHQASEVHHHIRNGHQMTVSYNADANVSISININIIMIIKINA